MSREKTWKWEKEALKEYTGKKAMVQGCRGSGEKTPHLEGWGVLAREIFIVQHLFPTHSFSAGFLGVKSPQSFPFGQQAESCVAPKKSNSMGIVLFLIS